MFAVSPKLSGYTQGSTKNDCFPYLFDTRTWFQCTPPPVWVSKKGSGVGVYRDQTGGVNIYSYPTTHFRDPTREGIGLRYTPTPLPLFETQTGGGYRYTPTLLPIFETQTGRGIGYKTLPHYPFSRPRQGGGIPKSSATLPPIPHPLSRLKQGGILHQPSTTQIAQSRFLWTAGHTTTKYNTNIQKQRVAFRNSVHTEIPTHWVCFFILTPRKECRSFFVSFFGRAPLR